MTQKRLKRVTQRGTLGVSEQWRGLRPGRKGAPARYGTDGARGC